MVPYGAASARAEHESRRGVVVRELREGRDRSDPPGRYGAGLAQRLALPAWEPPRRHAIFAQFGISVL